MKETDYKNQVIITVNKIKYNFKRYWWVFLITLAIGIGVIVKQTNDSLQEDEKACTAEALLSFQGITSEDGESEIADAINKYTDLYRDSNLITNEDKHLKLLEKLSETEDVIQNVNKKLNENGYDNYNASVETVQFQLAVNLVILSVNGKGSDRVTCLANAFSEVLSNQMNELLQYTDMTIVKTASTSGSAERKPFTLRSVISVKNLFIVILSMLTGCFILFIIIMFNGSAIDYEDVERICNTSIWGKLAPNNHTDLMNLSTVVQSKSEQNKASEVLFISLSNGQIIDDLIKMLKQKGSLLNVRLDSCIAFSKDSNFWNKIGESNNIIVVVRQGHDKMKTIDNLAAYMKLVDKPISGLVMVESSSKRGV